jgi:hypothetical protein
MNGLTKLGLAGVAGLMAAFPPAAGATPPGGVPLCTPGNGGAVIVPAAVAPTLLDHGWTVPGFGKVGDYICLRII